MHAKSKIICPSCRAHFSSEANLNRHRGAKLSPCREARRRAIEEKLKLIPDYDHRDPEQIPFSDGFAFDLDDDGLGTDSMAVDEAWYQGTPQVSLADAQGDSDMVDESDTIGTSNNLPEPSVNPHTPTNQKGTIRRHPNQSLSYGRGITTFEKRRYHERADGKSVYGDFKTADVFELAELMLTSQMSQRTESKLLRTKIVCLHPSSTLCKIIHHKQISKSKTPWKNARALLQDVDRLPTSSEWFHKDLTIPSTSEGGVDRVVDIYYRNPVDLVKELIGNPDFNQTGIMTYDPMEVYSENADGTRSREYDEAWTGDWWNKVQVRA